VRKYFRHRHRHREKFFRHRHRHREKISSSPSPSPCKNFFVTVTVTVTVKIFSRHRHRQFWLYFLSKRIIHCYQRWIPPSPRVIGIWNSSNLSQEQIEGRRWWAIHSIAVKRQILRSPLVLRTYNYQNSSDSLRIYKQKLSDKSFLTLDFMLKIYYFPTLNISNIF